MAATGLSMVLVDVCGKGATALPDAVQFAGRCAVCWSGLPEDQLMAAANAFLLRQPSDESIATAVQVVVDLTTGRYAIRSAGHPPVLHWQAAAGEWVVDNARGTALGVVDDPEFARERGRARAGRRAALLHRRRRRAAGRRHRRRHRLAAGRGRRRRRPAATVGAVPARIMEKVTRGDDDRAVLVLARE